MREYRKTRVRQHMRGQEKHHIYTSIASQPSAKASNSIHPNLPDPASI